MVIAKSPEFGVGVAEPSQSGKPLEASIDQRIYGDFNTLDEVRRNAQNYCVEKTTVLRRNTRFPMPRLHNPRSSPRPIALPLSWPGTHAGGEFHRNSGSENR